MTRGDIIRELGWPMRFGMDSELLDRIERVVRLAEAAEREAAAREREACAKLCDEVETQGHALWKRTYDPDAQGRSTGAADCAAAIRARGEK